MIKFSRINQDHIQLNMTDLEFIYLHEMMEQINDYANTMVPERAQNLHDALVKLSRSNGSIADEAFDSLFYFNEILKTIAQFNHFSGEYFEASQRFNASSEYNCMSGTVSNN